MSWRDRLGGGCLAGARWALYVSVLAPLVYSTGTIYPYVVPGALWFRATVSLAAVLAALALLTGRVRARPSRDFVAGSMAVYLAVASISALYGQAPLRSVFGSFERMGGVWAWAHFLVFYLLLRALLDADGWRRFLWLLVGTTGVAAGIGALQAWEGASEWHPLFGLEQVQATMGNQGYLSIYLVMGLTACGLLARRVATVPQRVLVSAVALLEASVLLASTIRTTLVVLPAAGLAAVAVLAASMSRHRLRRWIVGASAAVVLAGTAIFLARDAIGIRAVPVFGEASRTRLEEPSLQARLVAWEAAAEGIGASPLLGSGPENFRLVWDRHFSPRLYEHWPGDPPALTEVHNDYLESAAETGIVGLLTFLLFWTTVGRRAWHAARGGMDPPDAALVAACVTGYAVFLLAWFRTPTTFAAFTAILAFAGSKMEGGGTWLTCYPGPTVRGAFRRPRHWLVAGVALALSAAALAHTISVIHPASTLAEAARRNSVAGRVETHETAVRARVPGTAEVAREYAVFMASMDPGRLARTTGETRSAMERGFQGAKRALAEEIGRDPANARHRALMAGLEINRFHFDGDSIYLEQAIEAARAAVERSPPRLHYRRMLSDFLMNAGRPGDAMSVLDDARPLLGEVAELHYAIAKIHAAEDRRMAAARGLEKADSLGYDPEKSTRPVYLTVARSLLAAGDTARARSVLGMAGGRFTFDDRDD